MMATPLLSRDAAGLRPPRCVSHSISPTTITLHYGGPSPWTNADTSSPAAFRDSTDHNRCASIWRAWQSFHMDGKGWCDVAYNSAVCPHGVRFEGRGPGVRSGAQGTNTGNATSYAVVYLAGGDDPLTDEAKLGYLDEQDRYGVPLRHPHHFWHSTSCPGRVDDWIDVGFPRPGDVGFPPSDPPTLPPTAGAPPYPGLRSTSGGFVNDGPTAAIQLRMIFHGEGGHVPDSTRDSRYGRDPAGKGLEVDASFGPITERHVKWFQLHAGLTVDGKVGPRTWAALWRG